MVMTKNLHPKIQELRQQAKPITYRALSVDKAGNLVEERKAALDDGIVKGYLCIWGNKNSYGEILVRGCFAKSIREMGPDSNSNYKIKFRYNHGPSLALFRKLEEDATGLYFETYPLDDVPEAKRTITQLKSGTLNNFSVGFNYVWDKMEWDSENEAIVIKEAVLYEGSVVDIPADTGTFAYRSAEENEELIDEVEDFIDSLPRKFKLQARKLFAANMSLSDNEPLEQKRKALMQSGKPAEDKAIDYAYLSNNLKIFK